MFGPSLSPSQLAELLCDSKIGRVVFGPDSQPLDVGREHRTAPAPHPPRRRRSRQRLPVPRLRPKTHRCKVHHVHPWDPDGETSVCNCILLCSFHHGVIHKRGWINTFDGITYTVWKPDGELVGST